MKSQRYPNRVALQKLPQLFFSHQQVAEARKRSAAKRYLAKTLGTYINLPTQDLVRLCQYAHSNY